MDFSQLTPAQRAAVVKAAGLAEARAEYEARDVLSAAKTLHAAALQAHTQAQDDFDAGLVKLQPPLAAAALALKEAEQVVAQATAALAAAQCALREVDAKQA